MIRGVSVDACGADNYAAMAIGVECITRVQLNSGTQKAAYSTKPPHSSEAARYDTSTIGKFLSHNKPYPHYTALAENAKNAVAAMAVMKEVARQGGDGFVIKRTPPLQPRFLQQPSTVAFLRAFGVVDMAPFEACWKPTKGWDILKMNLALAENGCTQLIAILQGCNIMSRPQVGIHLVPFCTHGDCQD